MKKFLGTMGGMKSGKSSIGALIARADAARDAKHWAAAQAAYEEALLADPNLAHIWVQCGHARKECGQPEAALAAYEQALNLKPTEADTHLQIGHVRKILHDLSGAAEAYARAVELSPKLADARRELEALQLRGIRVPPGGARRGSAPALQPLHPQRTAAPTIDGSAIVTIAGKLGKSSGIGIHANAFIESLNDLGAGLQCIDTRPGESDPAYRTAMQHLAILDDPKAARASLVSVFCDVIANSPADMNFQKLPQSTVRLAYAVFDSSRIPEFWVTRLNSFDAVLVPDPCLLPVMQRSGVRRPVFVLPLALDYSQLATPAETPTVLGEDRFNFGCIAGFGLRKNLRTLIDVFADTFGDNPSVALHVHSTLNFSNHYDELQAYVAERKIGNVFLSCDVLSGKRYAKLLASFDAYVSVSKGEGYSITPREALYLGKPTILSDNTAHSTLVKSGLVLPVATKEYEAAHYEGMGGQDFGYQCVPDPAALKQAFTRMLIEYRRMRSRASEMRAFAEQFSIEQLRWKYRSITMPKDVFLGDENAIYDSHIVTNDALLFANLSTVRTTLKQRVPTAQRQSIAVMGNDGGFFSVFNTFLSYLVWNIGRPEVTSIVPDWRISEIQRHRNLTKFTSFCYGKRSDGNLWLSFFYPIPHQPVGEEAYNDAEFLSNSVVYDKFNEENEPLLTYIHAYRLYRSPKFKEWRRWYNAYLKEFIHFREHLLTQVDLFAANHFTAPYMIGCHVRHPSHSIEQPGSELPTVELFQQHVIRRTIGIKDWKVFLATDQKSVVEAFRRVFADRVVFRTDVARVQDEDDRRFAALPEEEKRREGHQIQHLTAADESRWSTRMADEVIVDALLLARCDTFIHVTSNIATAVSFLNPDIEMIYCE